MMAQLSKLIITVVGLAAVTVSSLAISDDRPQEVLDLIAEHQALEIKIRPLRYRIVAAESKDRDERFGPEVAPARVKATVAASESNNEAEDRIPERLRHKDRAASDDTPITDRLAALEKSARTERERVNRPDFGAGLSSRDKDLIAALKKLSALQQEFAVLEREVNAPGR